MLFFLGEGFRVIAHDRRGHGRSSQSDGGNEMDTYAADVDALVTELGLHQRDPHRPFDRRRRSHPLRRPRMARAGSPRRCWSTRCRRSWSRRIRTPAARRSRCSTASARLSPPTARSSTSTSRPAPSTASTGPARRCREGLISNWWRQGMMGSVKADYECIKAFSETDFTEDLKAIDVPVLVIHSEDDQIVPYADAGAAVGQAAQERHADDLQGPAARLPVDSSRTSSTPTSSPSSARKACQPIARRPPRRPPWPDPQPWARPPGRARQPEEIA